MIKVKRIGLNGVGVFKDKTVFDVPLGLTYLYGYNKLADGSGNASGKSTLVSSMFELFYGEPVIGNKQDKGKAGTRFVEFESGGKKVKVVASFKGKTEDLKIKVDGEVANGRTKANTREALEALWPIDAATYLTYGYLDSSLPHPLVRGSTADWKAFFTTFFGLDRLDAERKLFNAELAKIKKTKAAYTELKATFNVLKSDMLSKTDRADLEAKVEALRAKVKSLKKKYDQYQEVRRLIEFEQYAGPSIKAIIELVPDLREFEDRFTSLKKQVKAAERGQEQLEEWEAYKRDLKRWRTATEGLDMDTPMSELRAASEAYTKAELALSDMEDLEAPEPMKEPKQIKLDEKALVGEQVRLEHQLEHARKFKSGTCETCGQSVKAEPVSKIKEKLAAVEEDLERIQENKKAVKAYERYKEQCQEYEQQAKAVREKKRVVKDNKEKHELYLKRKQFAKPEVVEKPEGVVELEPLRERLAVFTAVAHNIETIIELESLTKEQRALHFDPTELNKLQDNLSVMATKLQVHNTVKVRAKEIKARLDELEAAWQKEKALELLIEAYSDKNVKRMIVEAISQHLMASVNQYASLVFKDYSFEFVWGTQIQIVVNRPEGSTDVRKLSGAESKLFTLILVLSLLKFVPKSKRLSLLVLDEPTASFSEETTEMFHTLLPHLQQIIPSILIITPDARERLEGANEYTVVRDRKGSKIVQGHPESIR